MSQITTKSYMLGRSVASFSYWLIQFGQVLFFLSISITTIAQTFPANFTQVAVATGLTAPTVAAFAPDGRIFIALQGGNLRVVKNGLLLPTPFVQLTVDAAGERGLLGIAFDPNFITNQYIYLYYTVPASGTVAVHNRISRFTANGDVAIPGSETVVLELNSLSSATNHNGGSIAFGPDQKLYVGVGENANSANSQDFESYLGKVLRINPDGSAPADNPFSAGSETQKRIWSYGLRNPYTITFQPNTNRLFVNDVGENNWEEINDATTGGLNFGWPGAEGTSSNSAYTNPVFAYHHGRGDGFGCAITGGAFYNPTLNRYPVSFTGKYFYQDYCNNWINVLDVSGPTAVRSTFATGLPGGNLGLTLGTDGYLYYLSKTSSSLYRIVYTGQTCQTVQNGSWHNSSVWSCGRLPLLADQATIRHVVNIGASLTGSVKQIKYETGGQLMINASGHLQLGL